MTETSDLYSASSLAERAKVSPSYVARLCRRGEIPATKLGTVWLIRAEDAEAWLAKRFEHHDEELTSE